MTINISARNYQILIAKPGESSGSWLDVTAACLGDDQFWSASDEPIGEDGIQRTSGELVLGIPIGQESTYNPWSNESRWAVGNQVIVKVANESGTLTTHPRSGLYIAAPVLPPYPGNWQLKIELCDRLTLSENYPAGVGTGTGAALPRTTAVNTQLTAAGLSLTGTIPGSNPTRIPDRTDSPVKRAGEMASAANGYLWVDNTGAVAYQGNLLFPAYRLFLHTVGADDAGEFTPIQSNERPVSDVEVTSEGEEEEDPFNPFNDDGSTGGPGNEDPDDSGSTSTNFYATKETVEQGSGSEVILTVQRIENWAWSGNTFTREVIEYARRGLVIPADVYQAVIDNTPSSVSFTPPSAFLMIQSLYCKETCVYEAGDEGRLIYKTIEQREPRGKVLAEYYKNNPVNLASQSLPDFLSLPATPTLEERTDYEYKRQSDDSDNRGNSGDDTKGQVRRITRTQQRLLGEIAGNATDISDFVASLEFQCVAEETEQYWLRRSGYEWEQHTIERKAQNQQAGSVISQLAVATTSHEVVVSSSGNAQPPSADRRRPDPDKGRLRKTIRKTATLDDQQRNRYRISNDYVRTKSEANDIAHTQAAIKRARQRGFRITTAFHDEWFDYGPQTRIDVLWNGITYVGVTDLVTFTLAGNQAIVVAECYVTGTANDAYPY